MDIKAGVLLSLKDQFSRGIRNAGNETRNFASGAIGAINRVDKAFSGAAATLASFGLTIGAGAAIKSTIDFEDRLTRLGLAANASGAQVNELKREIFAAASAPDIKLNPDEIVSAVEVIMEKTGNLKFARENLENIATAIKGAGTSGEAMGSVFAEFEKVGVGSSEEILALMDQLVIQGDKGAFTFKEFAAQGVAILSAYSPIGRTSKDILNAGAAMQIIMRGTKNADTAVTALSATMAELADPKRQEELLALGITVRDDAGMFRDLNEIMADIVKVAKERGNPDFLGTIFGMESMKAVRAYMADGHLYETFVDVSDAAGALSNKSATMANTFKSNLTLMQTSLRSFADKKLTEPLQVMTDFFNELAESPEGFEKPIRDITIAIAALGAVKIGAGVLSFMANLKIARGSGKVDFSGLTQASGGAGIPVHVTNWGGSAGASSFAGGGAPGAAPMVPDLTATGRRAATSANYRKSAVQSGIMLTAGVALQQGISMWQNNRAIDADTTLSGRERGAAKGANVGGALGTTLGTGLGAAGLVVRWVQRQENPWEAFSAGWKKRKLPGISLILPGPLRSMILP